MNRVYAVNLVLSGMLIGALIVVACTTGTSSNLADARAEDASSNTGTSTVRWRAADEDPAQLRKGAASLTLDPQFLVAGPIIVTEIVGDAGNRVWITSDGTCDPSGPIAEIGADNAPTGMRIYVAPGERLCVNVDSANDVGEGILWAGFLPYDA